MLIIFMEQMKKHHTLVLLLYPVHLHTVLIKLELSSDHWQYYTTIFPPELISHLNKTGEKKPEHFLF